MRNDMKALVKTRPEPGLWMDRVPVPEPGPQDVLIKIRKSAICGTDVHIWKWDEWSAKTIPVPMVVGHEFVGEIVQVGEPPEIYEHPNSRYVADFIGSVNMFEGRVSADEADYIEIAAPEIGGEIHIGHGVSCILGQQVWYAIRPEKISISRDRPEGRRNGFRAKVDEIAYMGNLSVFRLTLPSGTVMKVARANLSRHEEDGITWDDEIWISWNDTAGVVLTK